MPTLSDEAVRRYRLLLARYRTWTSGLLVAAWDRLETFDDTDADRYAAELAAALQGVKTATVAASSALVSLLLEVRPVAVSPADVPVEARMRDPFLAMWHAFAEDRPYDEAWSAGRSMASAVGFDFVQSTSRRTGDVTADKAKVRTRWRRVAGGDACPWCLDKTARTYRTSASADFGHDRCDCVAVPVVAA